MNHSFNFAHILKMAYGGLLLPLILTGCGGSQSASLTNLPTNDPLVTEPLPATEALLSQSETVASGTTFYNTITVNQSGTASYTHAFNTTPNQSGNGSFQSGSGTLSAALTAKFFQDLSAALPLQNLPEAAGTTSVTLASQKVQYQEQVGPIDNPTNPQEVALEADVVAIAKALGLPQY